MGSLAGRQFVVTGAAGAIGRATVARLLGLGAHCLLIDVDEARLEEVAGSLGPHVQAVPSRLESPAACEAALARLERPIYAFVHLAGIFVPEYAGPSPRDVYDRVTSANATNAFDLAHAVLPRLDPDQVTRMVFVSSLAFRRGSPEHIAYSMAKGALVGLVHALSRKLAPSVLVNGLAPGLIDTPMPRHLLADPEQATKLIAGIPLRRLGLADEVAGAILFLCGADSTYITGQVINVDGGIINS